MFSYDPANAETRAAAGPLTFEFNQGLMHVRMLSVRSTEAQATARLHPALDKALGPGGLTPLISAGSTERDLYEIMTADEGAALIAAFCPGAHRAWMSFSRPRLYGDLRVQVLGDQSGVVRRCRTLDFNFHGEWRLPATGGTGKTPTSTPSGPRS